MKAGKSLALCTIGTAIAISLTGCASITTGTTQSIAVETRLATGQEVLGANCKLVNSKGTWFVTTPGSVTIHRATMSPMDINCTKEGQRQLGVSSTKPKSKGMTWGNLIFGGVIGVVADGITGAAGYYPSPITVIMEAISTLSGNQPPERTMEAGTFQESNQQAAPADPTNSGSGEAGKVDWRNWGTKEG